MEKIKEKIRNVIELMEGAKTEGEAKAASLALQRLLVKHHLSMSDIEVGNTTGSEVQESEEIAVSEKWKRTLAYYIAKNMRCLSYVVTYRLGTKYSKKVVFVGLEEDICAVKEFFCASISVAKKLYRSFSKEMRENYSCTPTARQRQSWYLGFAKGLNTALEEQSQSCEEMALALKTPQAVKDYMGTIKFSGRSRSRGSTVDKSAYNAGVSSGRSYGSRDRLTA